MKKAAVVILNWNGRELLERFLPSVIRYSSGDATEIIVADNASTDNSVAFIKEIHPEIRIIELPENFGYAKGYNEALKQVDAEYAILLNSDVEVTGNWLDSIIDYFEANKDISVIQPKILSFNNKEYFEYAGACGGFIDKYGYPFCRGRIFNTVEQDHKQYDEVKNVFWVSGACMAIRLGDFRLAGGFDPLFFAHMEEIDLCWRLNARGKRLVCLPGSAVYHVGGATLDKESPDKTYLNFRNNLLMLYKNLPEERLGKVLRLRFFLDYLATVPMIFAGKFDSAKAVRRARRDFKRMRASYKSIRQENLQKTVNPLIHTIYPKSILWSYYIRGLKIFGKLII